MEKGIGRCRRRSFSEAAPPSRAEPPTRFNSTRRRAARSRRRRRGKAAPRPARFRWDEKHRSLYDDGRSDILLQSTSGQVAVWEMNGSSITGGGVVSANPGPTWKAVGTGDFNDDGRSDILLQSTSGQVAIWEMNGPNLLGGGTLSADPGPSWQAIGTGGEGSSDILFQNMGTGQAALWDMKRNRHRRRGRREPQCRAELEGSAADLTDRGNSRATTRPGRSNAHGLKRRLLGRDPRTPCIEQDGQDQLKQS